MNVLFLDIDYILNSDKFEQRLALKDDISPYPVEIDPECVQRLNTILSKMKNFNIVISSDWRAELSLSKFREIFNHFKLNAHVLDMTSAEMSKSNSIKDWVFHNKPKEFIILDDDSLFDLSDPLFKNFYKLSKTGLLDRDVNLIIQFYLNLYPQS